MRSLKRFKLILILSFVCVLFGMCFFLRRNKIEIEVIQVPLKDYYPTSPTARCIWDMEIFENKLYIGCGDYDNNSGPTPLLCCDLNTLGDWECERIFNEEQIGRFLLIDEKLIIPGFDPVGSSNCAFYQCTNGMWETSSVLQEGLHCFDVIKFDGKLFAGVGAPKGSSSIVYSEDNISYKGIPIYKNGKEIHTNDEQYIRTYNFYHLNDVLFAEVCIGNLQENTFRSEVYKYQDESFVYYGDLTEKLSTGLLCKNLPPIRCKATLNNTVFLTTGFLYVTKDMQNFTQISFPKSALVYDIYEYEDKLYFLTATTTDQGYKVAVYSTTSENGNDFRKEISIDSLARPTAFVVDNKNIFIAIGEWDDGNTSLNGSILNIGRK